MSVCHRSRRAFLRASLGFATLAGLPFPLRSMQGMDMNKSARPQPNKASPSFNPDVDIELTCQPGSVSIFDGPSTRVLQYVASLQKGPEDTLTTLPDSYLGRVMRFRKGQKIRISLRNGLSEPTITHWHGLHVPAAQDGHPMYALRPGETFVYEFEMLNRASMNIYHPHPHEATARQVYYGLAGAILVGDEEERALDLPRGEYELPLVIQDKHFDAQNQLVYVQNMHQRMTGFYGNHILVNGRPNYRVDVASRAYRLRLLNGSTARIYKLAWDDNTPLTVLGVDGGLLAKPENRPYVMLAPGERLDLWVDCSGRAPGTQLTMRSRPFSGVLPAMAEHMHGSLSDSAVPVGSDYPLFTLRVTRTVNDSPKLPTQLSRIDRLSTADTVNADKPIPIALSEGPMAMLINGRPYASDDLLPFERIPVNTTQLLEIYHSHGENTGQHVSGSDTAGHGMMGGRNMMGHGMGMGMGMMGQMMSMAHPIHLHGQYFQILDRRMSSANNGDYASVKDGFITSGWKDTVLVMPGERVRIIKPFHDFKGLFMYHCHNLEHEDMGMMREFLVV